MTAKSWIESANRPDTDFGLDNLPWGKIADGSVCVAIGDLALNVEVALGEPIRSVEAMMPRSAELRRRLTEVLREDADMRPPERAFRKLSEIELIRPIDIPDYTDFYASIHHAMNVGRLFRPDNPLLPNYKHIPIGYHGRASSIVVSGTRVRRPNGQLAEGCFGPTQQLDFELELGCVIGRGNDLGYPIALENAEEHILGFCLVNDWSARDIQRWEYQPLGPFLGKSFATTMSPWIVPREALEPYRIAGPLRPDDSPDPLAYLSGTTWAYDITLEVWVNGELLGRSSSRDLYWTFGQLIVHHTSNGCNLRPGDLLASGTISGAGPESRGCLLEMKREFLNDGDVVTMRAYAARSGLPRIGFGECTGVVISRDL
jgi:fumarylacetoacetase